MAYLFYLEDVLLPVTPSKLNMRLNGKNKTYTLINDGEISVIKKAGLTDIEFEALLPNSIPTNGVKDSNGFVSYGGVATYIDGYKPAPYFLEVLERHKTDLKPFQFKVTREKPNGQSMYDTDITVSLESYEIIEDAKANGLDVKVKVKLKQYVHYATKTVEVEEKKDKSTNKATLKSVTKKTRMVDTTKQAESEKFPTTYKVKKGDCLWNIAKKHYGNGALYPKIQQANGLKNSTLIFPDQILTIPK